MRIGVDMLAIQSPQHGHRGIGRFGSNLLSALLARGAGHEFILYAYDELSRDRLAPWRNTVAIHRVGLAREHDGASVTQRLDRLTTTNTDALDVLLVLSAFEPWESYLPPARPRNGLRMAAVVHDLIPFLFPYELGYDPLLMRYYRGLDELRGYDVLLSNSEATRRDCLAMLGLPGERVVTIGGGCDRGAFFPDPSEPMPEASARVLQRLGISRPFVLNVGGVVARKNTGGVMEAFAKLPARLRRDYHLVLTFKAEGEHFVEFRDWGRDLRIMDSLVMTDEVSDEALRVLYQRCAAFVLPSQYEGFGLPLLEAMQCGAVVIAGNNSSQVEVVGDAGLLANATDTTEIATKLALVLEDRDCARTFRERAVLQASRFSWEAAADRTLEALERLPRPSRRVPRLGRAAPATKPRIAFFSPLPPRKSGVSDYSALLLEELKSSYTIDLFHDVGYVPDVALRSDEFECIDARLFEIYAGQRAYHANVYQMGNSRYHTYLYETALRHPGVVTLHDFCLAGFHLNYGRSRGSERDYIAGELRLWYPEQADEIRSTFARLPWDWDVLAKECARRGWYLNRRLFDSPNLVVVHSPWCRGQVLATRPEHAERTAIIPHGIWPRRIAEQERAAIRARFDIADDALVVASFGFIHPDKMNPEALDAFVNVARAEPRALFLFAGEDADGGLTRRHAASLGLLDRVRFLGRQGWGDFNDLIAVTDVGVNLRLPPTNGETSGALLILLAAGVPTIVTEVATFADYPNEVVRKVRWESEGIEGLRAALLTLVQDPPARARLGRSARDYVSRYHEWSLVAKQYVDVIERSHRERADATRASRTAARALAS